MIPNIIHNFKDNGRYNNILHQMKSQEIKHYNLIEAEMIQKHPIRGIVRSHKKIVQTAKDVGNGSVLIAEDDLNFLCQGAYSTFLNLSRQLPDDWNLFLGGFYDANPVSITDQIAKLEGKLSGLHFYLINQNFYDTFLNADENYNLDYWLSAPEFGNCVAYATYPMLCIQNDGYSYNIGAHTKYNEGLRARYKLISNKEFLTKQ